MSGSYTQAGDHDRAHWLAADAEALARTRTDTGAEAQAAVAGLATAAAQAGDFDRAETLARTITDPERAPVIADFTGSYVNARAVM